VSDSPPPPAPETLAEEPAGPDGTPDGAPRRKLRNWQLAALTLVAVAFLVGAYLVGKGGGDDPSDGASPPSSRAPTSVAPAPAPAGYTTFTDPITGASLSYPQDWTVDSEIPADNEIRLLATLPGSSSGISLRSTSIGANITAADLEQVKKTTDERLAAQGLTEVLEQEALTVNGLSAVYYRYNFTDRETGEQGVHEHFFIYHGGFESQLVFQALPGSEHAALSEPFARIATTFRAPDPPAKPLPPATTTTSTP